MNLLSEAVTIDRIAAIEGELTRLRFEAYVRAGLPLPTECGRIKRMVHTAARIFDVSPGAITGPIRSGKFVRARFAVMWAAREIYGLSTPHIGRHMGGRDHTTVLGALKRAEQLRDTDEDYRSQTDALVALFRPKSEEAENGPRNH